MKIYRRYYVLFLTVTALLFTVTTSGFSQALQSSAVRPWSDHFHPRSLAGQFSVLGTVPGTDKEMRFLPVITPQLLSQVSVIDTAIIWSTKDTLREVFTFDARGKRTLALLQKLDGELWVDSMRQTSTYDERGNMLSDTYEFFSTAPLRADNIRALYTYDESDRILSFEKQMWDSGQWTPVYRRAYSYESHGQVLTDLRQNWSRATAQWENVDRTTNAYDEEGRQLSSLTETSYNGAWQAFARSTFSHDLMGRDSSIYSEQWQGTSWQNTALESFAYDSLGNCVSDRLTLWRDDHWEQSLRLVMVYDANRRLVQGQGEWWSDTAWVPDSRDTWVYDGNGRQVYWMAEKWIDNQWAKERRWDYTYDATGVLSQWMASIWLEPGWTLGDTFVFGIVDSMKNEYWFYNTYGVKLHQRTVQTGVDLAKGQVPEAYSLFQNYPNPFNPKTTIRYELPTSSVVRLSVYDILGREVSLLVNERKNAGSYEVRFDGAGLSSGVYLYRLQAGEFVATKRLMVLK